MLFIIKQMRGGRTTSGQQHTTHWRLIHGQSIFFLCYAHIYTPRAPLARWCRPEVPRSCVGGYHPVVAGVGPEVRLVRHHLHIHITHMKLIIYSSFKLKSRAPTADSGRTTRSVSTTPPMRLQIQVRAHKEAHLPWESASQTADHSTVQPELL
jgi:hypothetical protein